MRTVEGEQWYASLEIQDYFRNRVTLKQLADEAGVSRQYVWAVAQGREAASERVVEAARRLGVVRPT